MERIYPFRSVGVRIARDVSKERQEFLEAMAKEHGIDLQFCRVRRNSHVELDAWAKGEDLRKLREFRDLLIPL